MNFHERFQDQGFRPHAFIEGGRSQSYGARCARLFFASVVVSVIIGVICLILTWIGLNQQLVGIVIGAVLVKLIENTCWRRSDET
jgi:hypothetical protein